MIAHSQLAPLPSGMPFKIVSKTIGQGAYACIKKARLHGQTQVFAVKFIHKDYALRHGRVTKKQLDMEITLHQHIGQHQNIIQYFSSGEDESWRWIAMELAEGGDLFDKIESDVGVGQDIAHVYFTQLVRAVEFMHAKGVGHRDIKPENILLSVEGNLKIADFGLATLFQFQGKRKISTSPCGSPPYTAPEVLTPTQAKGYYGDVVDVWSCGVVLFVLLVGNTPWDEPVREKSYEFNEYVKSPGLPDDELWHNLPAESVPLLRGMMNVDASKRFSMEQVKQHPWFKRSNRYMRPDGSLSNPVALATQMFETMHIDFSKDPLASQRSSVPGSQDAMDIDSSQKGADEEARTPAAEIQFDWETQLPSSQSQNESKPNGANKFFKPVSPSSSLDNYLADDPMLSQFAPQPAVPISRTQLARRFGDILPAHTLTRFVSTWSMEQLLPLLAEALRKLGIPVADDVSAGDGNDAFHIKIKLRDDRNCPLSGDMIMEQMRGERGDAVGCQALFVKSKGDPVEWRRMFKKIVVLCQHAVWKPES